MAVAMQDQPHAVVGNAELLMRLDRDIRGGRLSHAYILDGRKGSGRHTLARHICAALACENRPGRSPSLRDEDQMGFFDLLDDAPPPREIPPDAPLPCRQDIPSKNFPEREQ